MRLGMILDIMQKAVSQDRIDSNCVQIERYYGMLPILRKEQMNVIYVYNRYIGLPIMNYNLLDFKEDQAPKPVVA